MFFWTESVCWGRRDGKEVPAKSTSQFNKFEVRNPFKQEYPIF
jgi:hypothetical protein